MQKTISHIVVLVFALNGSASGEDLDDKASDVSAPAKLIGDETIVIRERTDTSHSRAHEALTNPHFVSTFQLRDWLGQAPSIAQKLSDMAGISIHRLGGGLGNSWISIHGSPAAHTNITLDGVPISQFGSATFDIGQLRMQEFDSIAVSQASSQTGSGASSIELATGFAADSEKPWRVGLGGGSFGHRWLAIRRVRGIPDAPHAMVAAISAETIGGDYSYWNDNRTPLNLGDDSMDDRQNNDAQLLSGHVRYRYQKSDSRWFAGLRVRGQNQGIAGPGGSSITAATLAGQDVLVDGKGEFAALGGRQIAVLYAALQNERFSDRMGEIGLSAQDKRYQTWVLGGLSEQDWQLGERAALLAKISARVETYEENNHAGTYRKRADASRLSLSPEVSLPLTIHEEKFTVVPSLGWALEHVSSADDVSGAASNRVPAQDHGVWLPKLASVMRLSSTWSIKAEVARYARFPTAFERFGDRGAWLGNPGLMPEHGTSWQIGQVLATDSSWGPLDRVLFESSVFFHDRKNTIAITPGASLVIGAQNLGQSTVLGAEHALSLRFWQALTLSGNYTQMSTEQRDSLKAYQGNALPGRPRHEVSGKAEWNFVLGDLPSGLWGEAIWSSSHFLDPANLRKAPERKLFAAGARTLVNDTWLISMECENLLDERTEYVNYSPTNSRRLPPVKQAIVDVVGYPLPGRSFWLSIVLEM